MRRSAATLLLVLTAFAPRPVLATQTDPVLEIARAIHSDAAAGQLVQIDATFPADDLVQRLVPLQILLRDSSGGGTRYLRVALGEGVFEGDAAALADGLDAGDVAPLLGEGAPLPSARVSYMGTRRIELWIPHAFSLANAEVQLFIVYEGDPILSNPAPIEGDAP